jgi:hypothetical protein
MAGYIGSKSSVTLVDGYTEAEADAEFVNDPNGAITVSGSNVGIGTSSTDNKVNIQESALAGRGASNGNTSMTLEHATDTGIQFFSAGQTQLRFGDAASTGAGSIIYEHATDKLRLNTGSLTTFEDGGVERMRIDSLGNVGIGTSSPVTFGPNTYGLTINGTGNYQHLTLQNNGNSDFSIYTNGANGTIINQESADPIYFNTDGTERMRIDSSGAVTMPAQPAFLVRPSGYQLNIPNLATTSVLFGTEVFDQNSDITGTTFTAPVTGKYQLSYGLRLQQLNIASSYYEFNLLTSNRTYQNILDPRALDTQPDYWTITLSVLADMDAGDTAKVTVLQAFGASQMDIHNQSYFSGYLVA